MSISFIIDATLGGIVIIFALIGVTRGALRTILDLFGWVTSIIVSVIVVRFLGAWLLEIEGIKALIIGEAGSLAAWIKGFVPDFGGILVSATPEEISEAMQGNIMSLIIPYINTFLITAGNSSYADMPLQTAIAQFGAIMLYYAILTLILFIILRVLFGQMEKAANSMRKKDLIKSLDNLVGLFVGAIKGAAVAAILLVVFALTVNLPFLGFLKTAYEQTVVAKPAAEIILAFINSIVDLNGLFSQIMPPAA